MFQKKTMDSSLHLFLPALIWSFFCNIPIEDQEIEILMTDMREQKTMEHLPKDQSLRNCEKQAVTEQNRRRLQQDVEKFLVMVSQVQPAQEIKQIVRSQQKCLLTMGFPSVVAYTAQLTLTRIATGAEEADLHLILQLLQKNGDSCLVISEVFQKAYLS